MAFYLFTRTGRSWIEEHVCLKNALVHAERNDPTLSTNVLRLTDEVTGFLNPKVSIEMVK